MRARVEKLDVLGWTKSLRVVPLIPRNITLKKTKFIFIVIPTRVFISTQLGVQRHIRVEPFTKIFFSFHFSEITRQSIFALTKYQTLLLISISNLNPISIFIILALIQVSSQSIYINIKEQSISNPQIHIDCYYNKRFHIHLSWSK